MRRISFLVAVACALVPAWAGATSIVQRFSCHLGEGPDTCFDMPTRCVPGEANQPIATDCGIFVSSSLGSDLADGELAHPVATIAKALLLARTRTIYLCAETFDEAVHLPGGTRLFGGLDCHRGWEYVGTRQRTTLTADADAVPLQFVARTGRTIVRDLHVVPRGTALASIVEGVEVEFMASQIGRSHYSAPAILEPVNASATPQPPFLVGDVPPPAPVEAFVHREPSVRRYGMFVRLDAGVEEAFNRVGRSWQGAVGGDVGLGLDKPLARIGSGSALGVFGRFGVGVAGQTDALGAHGPDWLLTTFSFYGGPYLATRFVDLRVGPAFGPWMGGEQAGVSFGAWTDVTLHPAFAGISQWGGTKQGTIAGVMVRLTTSFVGVPAWSIVPSLDLRFAYF